jgi:hypothetical protein
MNNNKMLLLSILLLRYNGKMKRTSRLHVPLFGNSLIIIRCSTKSILLLLSFEFYLMGEVNEEGIVQARGDKVDIQKRIGLFNR